MWDQCLLQAPIELSSARLLPQLTPDPCCKRVVVIEVVIEVVIVFVIVIAIAVVYENVEDLEIVIVIKMIVVDSVDFVIDFEDDTVVVEYVVIGRVGISYFRKQRWSQNQL